MKITAEFNSLDEMIRFGSKLTTIIDPEYFQEPTVEEKAKEAIKEEELKKPVREVPKEDDTEITKPVQLHSPDKEEKDPVKEESKEEVIELAPLKVTKEMVREILGNAMKAGKQKEVKELVAKYGASKVPDLKEEDYAAVYEEAEALL